MTMVPINKTLEKSAYSIGTFFVLSYNNNNEVDFSKCIILGVVEFRINDYMTYYNNSRYKWNLKR